MEKEKRTRREARGRRNGKSASVCGHYGTTAIIRDFPFAPYLFLVSVWRARVLTRTPSPGSLFPSLLPVVVHVHAGARRRGKCTWLETRGTRNEPRMAFQRRSCVYTATRRWKEASWTRRRRR